jgi:PQQ enzyme repeat
MTRDPSGFPRGIADPARGAAYIADAAGGISAIDLADGRLLWSTEAAARPLLLWEDRLAGVRVVQPNRLQIVLLDVAGGSVVLASDPVVLPDWVVAGVRNTESFAVDARGEDGFLVLTWEAHRYYRGGAAPPQRLLEHATGHAAGTARIDLGTGRTAALPMDGPARQAVATREPSPSPAPEPGARETCALGRYTYYVVDEPAGAGMRRSVLRAREAASGKVLWDFPLEQWRPSKPAPLRP